ncbi:hypothetical protein [Coleofasciculus sp.]|uniref:hypothetical protein n=1 Tax=Coleofasciculus sp. TaxID=3100458 RepID=UPI003A39D590
MNNRRNKFCQKCFNDDKLTRTPNSCLEVSTSLSLHPFSLPSVLASLPPMLLHSPISQPIGQRIALTRWHLET